MPRRMIATTILLVALELATTTSVCAQSAADLDHTMRAMKLRMTALNTARKNLEQIEMHAADHEQNAVRNITDADVVVFSSAVKVFTVAFIASGMKSPDDIAFTQRQFGLLARSLVTTADEELTQLNANLPNIAAPTAVLEATNIRDAVVDLRDILKPFVAQE